MSERVPGRVAAPCATGEVPPTASDMLAAIAAGTTTPAALVEQHLAFIERHEDVVRAWSFLDPQGARARAEAQQHGATGAVLRGIPVGLKDNIDTADMPTAYGSDIHAGHHPGRDAACVAALRLAGANPLGKTVCAEFAHRAPGATTNPWNPQHTPGGSSSGSAAAVAAGMVPLALGSQTTGSVLRPAAYCGVIGYKPTWGEFNTSGMLANTPSFDTLGVMARCVADLVLVRRCLLDDSVPSLERVPVAGLRVGICRTPWWREADEETRALLERVAGMLDDAGATAVEFDAGGAFDGLHEANVTVSGYEFARTLSHERRVAMDRLSGDLRDGRMADGLRARYADYVRAGRCIERACGELDAALQAVDVVLTPSAPGPAPRGLASTGSAVFNMPWTTLHVPAISLPVACSAGPRSRGLPLGVQLVAARHADDRLLAVAASVFEAVRA